MKCHITKCNLSPISNDEIEEGDPGSDSDFEIATKKEVRGVNPKNMTCINEDVPTWSACVCLIITALRTLLVPRHLIVLCCTFTNLYYEDSCSLNKPGQPIVIQ